MRQISDLENIERGRDTVVAACGSSLTENKDKILEFIKKRDAVVIGMNKMTNFVTPKYHLWTNRKRWNRYGHVCKKESIKLIGIGLNFNKINKNCHGECIPLSFTDKKGEPIGFQDNHISGFFRSTGNLSIMLCHIMGAKNIYVVGLDGLTLYPQKEYDSLKRKHHCDDYGEGNTAEKSWKRCVEVDDNILYSLNLLRDYGIKFEILTPTKFKDFYNPDILGI